MPSSWARCGRAISYPGIRKVAEDLVMNPNTVAKAYREMEHAGLVVLRHGAGAFVAGDQGGDQRNMQKGRTVVHRTVNALRDLGLDDGAIRRLLESELAEISEEVNQMISPAIQVHDLTKSYGPNGLTLLGPARQYLRIPGSQRIRQDHHAADPDGIGARGKRHRLTSWASPPAHRKRSSARSPSYLK